MTDVITPRAVDKTGRMLQVCDCVIYGLDSFNNKPQGWRVTCHYYREEHDDWWAKQQLGRVAKPQTGDELTHHITCELVEESILKEYFSRLERGLPASNRYRYVRCRPEEATHVGLYCICGTIAPISECTFEHVVDWDEKRIRQEQERAVSERALDPLWRNLSWQWE